MFISYMLDVSVPQISQPFDSKGFLIWSKRCKNVLLADGVLYFVSVDELPWFVIRSKHFVAFVFPE